MIRESWRRTLKEESLGGGLIRSSVDMIVTMYLSSGNMGEKLKWSEVGRKINSLGLCSVIVCSIHSFKQILK